MPLKPVFVLLATWVANPGHAIVGLVGIAWFVWSLWPVTEASDERLAPATVRESAWCTPRMSGAFWRRAEGVWLASRSRMVAAIAGSFLFAWSVWPVLSMP